MNLKIIFFFTKHADFLKWSDSIVLPLLQIWAAAKRRFADLSKAIIALDISNP